MLDIITSMLVILLIIPLVYFTSQNFNNVFSLVILILISIPTIMAMINGAPFVPTPMERVRKMVALAKIKKGQRVYDLGCGDGRFVYIAANEYGAKATGIELSPLVYLLAIIRKFFWGSKAQIILGNFKMRDLSDAEVIFCYLLPESLKKIQPELDKQIKKGTKIFSYAFEIPNWKLIHTEERNPKLNLAPVYVYEKI
jgi:SAM-dependent methyltransferase